MLGVVAALLAVTGWCRSPPRRAATAHADLFSARIHCAGDASQQVTEVVDAL
jgi:hypothetical protein